MRQWMRRYATSKFRIGFLLLMIAACVFVVGAGNAQTNGGSAAGAANPNDKIPQGLFNIVMSNKDPVFFLIVLCSVLGVTWIIQGFVKNRRSVVMPEASINHIRELINQRQFKELIEYTESDPTFVSRSLNPALKRAGQGFNAMKEAMETAVGEQTAEHFRRIEFLNIIGNLGPLLGLLGTVLGMIDAFSKMGSSGPEGASPAVLAGGISKALAHTFLGLMLAVPCLAAFGFLRTMVDRLTIQASLVAEELLLMIKPAEAKPAATGATRGAAAPVPAMGVAAPARKAPMPAVPPPAPAV